ncbi:aminotransferase class V-fold PLP-dependent enzyme [Runella sp. CRIBMP]|uniref:trans-sulfuration enzyme family protein n=1 Tax=Runella sp. CRIBMP TaxID=2683261 RepID=UPI001411E0A0|nr:aminotransferase class I/II-fold pyridoxal phosphate-dependent enzyme [Runella sp. CRIBMP]NBB22746.1 aminotransferase class V-fold PLP-dependent enzyme [Runella sp. CRIBMP]
MHYSHIINELAEDREHYFNAVSPPIVQTSNFVFNDFASLRAAFEDEMSAYLYSRGVNPTVDILRQKLAALDEAEDCLVLNSGASAIFCAVMSNVQAGDHIVSVHKPYTWAWKLFDNILPRYNVSTTYVDGTLIENFEAALQPNTKVIYLESPNTLTFDLQDLAAVAQLAKSRGIVTIIDNSYCSPLFQKPHRFGIDLSLQSATKYIGGHSDTVAGVLTGSKAMIKQIFDREALNTGAFISPFNGWLLLRGLRTLPIRLKHISESTHKVVAFLKNHPAVERVYFPLDPDFPQYELAKKQMTGACGLVTIALKVERYDQIEKFAKTLKHFLLAVSWGGHESLIMPKCAGLHPQEFDAQNPEHHLVRLYIGLEEVDYLIEDLKQALNSL